MSSLRWRTLAPYFTLAAIWIVTRIWLVPNAELWAQWELWQARKLLEYGFWARGGALMAPPFMAGRVPFPEDFNYSDHPYSMVWFLTGLFAVGGWRLCVGFLLASKLAGTLALYTLLRRYFTPAAAWWSTLLFILTPSALDMDVCSNIIGIAAALFPFAALLAIAVREGRVRPFWLGLMVFAGVQTSWFFVPFGPALIWLASPSTARASQFLPGLWRWPGARSVLIGGFLASALFFVQFFHYVPDVGVAYAYLRHQAASGTDTPSRLHLLRIVLARHVYFIGPALGLAALGGLRCFPADAAARRLVQASLLFAAGFFVIEIVLAQFCVIEESPYFYLIQPAAVLAAVTFQRVPSRRLKTGLGIVAIAATIYIFFRNTVPQIPAVPRALAPVLASHIRPDEVALSNLRPQHPPFAVWDAAGPGKMNVLVDRFILLGCNDRPTIDVWGRLAGRNFGRAVYIYCPDQPLTEELLNALKTHGTRFAEESFQPPPQPMPPAARIRMLIWKFSGHPLGAEDVNAVPAPIHLQFYRMEDGWAQLANLP